MIAAVIGGGIAGILSAILLKPKFNKVYLIEKEDHLGGLLKSYQTESGLSFDYGSHFLRDTGIKELDEILYGDFSEKLQVLGNLNGGGYHASQYNDQTAFLDARTLPEEIYNKGMIQFLESSEHDVTYNNLDEQLRGTFGEVFTEHLFKPILENKYFGCDLGELIVNSNHIFGLTRIIGFTPVATRELKKSRILDQKLGFHSSLEGVTPAKNYYPKQGGVGEWVEHLVQKFTQLGGTILTNTAVNKVVHSDQKIQAVELTNGERIKCDHLVWTIPVFPCIRACGFESPKQVKAVSRLTTSIYHFAFDQPLLTDVHWIQCHEPAFSTFRITLYPNFQSNKTSSYHLTAEVISRDVPDLEKMSNKVYKELSSIGIISSESKILFRKNHVIGNGFPLPTHQLTRHKKFQLEFIRKKLKNVTFLGKGSGTSFLMHNVLAETFNVLNSLKCDYN